MVRRTRSAPEGAGWVAEGAGSGVETEQRALDGGPEGAYAAKE
jgi:hypothetical protein